MKPGYCPHTHKRKVQIHLLRLWFYAASDQAELPCPFLCAGVCTEPSVPQSTDVWATFWVLQVSATPTMFQSPDQT